ncbi:Uncharacterized protein LW94_3774 [Fusarium fujikuroi]|nr:Uncharacterized protein LW94_3774 [Fusarium fujikuroi]
MLGAKYMTTTSVPFYSTVHSVQGRKENPRPRSYILLLQPSHVAVVLQSPALLGNIPIVTPQTRHIDLLVTFGEKQSNIASNELLKCMAPHAWDTTIISAYYIQAELITFMRHVTNRIRVFAINPIDWCITEILVTENDKRRYCELNGHEAQPVCIT